MILYAGSYKEIIAGNFGGHDEGIYCIDFDRWGKCYAVALEPWTSSYTQKPEGAIAKEEWLYLKAGQVVATDLTAGRLITA